VPKDSQVYSQWEMDRSAFLNAASRDNGHGHSFVSGSRMSQASRGSMMARDARQAEIEAASAAPTATLALEKGCYLTNEPFNQGTLFCTWSATPVEGAIAYFKPIKNVPAFKYRQNGGRSELQRGVNGNVHFKKYCLGWCGFFKMAREFEGEILVINKSQTMESLGKSMTTEVKILFNRETVLAEVDTGVSYNTTEWLPTCSAIAVVKGDCLDFEAHTMSQSMFTNNAEKFGAQISF